jgi:hypothetical protein
VGYTPEEVMGKNLVQEFITDEFKTAVQAVLDQALHGEETGACLHVMYDVNFFALKFINFAIASPSNSRRYS